MREPYLEVTFRHGRPLAAYLYLPRSAGDRSRRTVKADGGLIVDYTESGKPIGIEITAPAAVAPQAVLPACGTLYQASPIGEWV